VNPLPISDHKWYVPLLDRLGVGYCFAVIDSGLEMQCCLGVWASPIWHGCHPCHCHSPFPAVSQLAGFLFRAEPVTCYKDIVLGVHMREFSYYAAQQNLLREGRRGETF
jgi:hypothetical protein